jgi:prevent-host-death family protein
VGLEFGTVEYRTRQVAAMTGVNIYYNTYRICGSELEMQQIIGVTELQRKFRSFFEGVVSKRTPLVLTRGSRPEAVLIPYEDYLRFQQMQESEVLARFDKVWNRLAEVNAAVGDDEFAADIKTARQG